MYVLLLVEGDGGGDVLRAEGRIAAVDDVFEIGRWNLRGRDVEGEDFVCEVLEGQVLPFRRPVAGKGRNLLWDEKAAVRGKTLQYNLLEGELETLGQALRWHQGLRCAGCTHVIGASPGAQVALRCCV
jgi:hypothetical protein